MNKSFHIRKTHFTEKLLHYQHINQWFGTIPTIKSDWKISQVNAFLLKEIKHFANHVPEYVWFGCVTSTLFTDRSDIKGYYPLAYFDGYGNDILTVYRFVTLAGEPAICETDEFSCSIDDCIIDAESYSQSGEGCRTFGNSTFDQRGSYMASGDKQEFSGQKDAPYLDGRIYLVFVYTQGLHQMIRFVPPSLGGTRSEYVKDMSGSQHQQYLNSILRVGIEYGREKFLKKGNGLSNLLYHNTSPC